MQPQMTTWILLHPWLRRIPLGFTLEEQIPVVGLLSRGERQLSH